MKTAGPQRPRVPREAIHGVFLLDKSLGVSSQTAMQQVRRLLHADKCGHGGTLDPLASGLLPLLFGEATKFAQDLLAADKTYSGTICLGVRTSTDDREGDVVERREVRASEADILEAIKSLTGEIDQIPPMYSALKRDGKPLYAYARAGQVLDIPARRVTIHGFAMRGLADHEVHFEVRCSKGTYIRSLARDLGEKLGCGAHLSSLRREAIHHDGRDLRVSDACSEMQLEAIEGIAQRREYLLPLDALVQSLPQALLSTQDANRFMQGQRLRLDLPFDRQVGPDESIRVYRQDPLQLLGLAHYLDGVLSPQRLVSASLLTTS
jgi:tRNA pseudouridine55 synthase